MKKVQTKLEKYLSYKNLPFYSKSDFTTKDRKDFEAYHKLEDEIETEAAKLKKGDKVQFNFPKKIANYPMWKLIREGKENYVDQILEGIVSKPLYLKKRMRMGEDCSVKTIKVSDGKYIYEVSPNQIIKL